MSEYPATAAARLLAETSFRAELKLFEFELLENSRGVFLKVCELANGKKNEIRIPRSGMRAAGNHILAMADKAEKQQPEA